MSAPDQRASRWLFIADSGVVFAGAPGGDCQSATFPQVCVTREERWLCAFRAAPQKASNAGQRVLLTHSDDCGASWGEPIEPFPPTPIDGRPGRIRIAALTALDNGQLLAVVNWVDDSNPSLPYFNEETEGLLDTRILLSFSADCGMTWSPLRVIDTTPFNVPTPLTGPVLKLSAGDLACQFEINKPYDNPAPWRHASVMLFSKDGGRTWPEYAVVAQDPSNRVFYWDQRPSVLPGGRILDVFWTFDRVDARYLNIHARESLDSGRHWSELWDTGVPGQPGPPFQLGDGAIAMPYVDRKGAPMMKVRRSRDAGRTWPSDQELVVHTASGGSQTRSKSSMQDAWAEMYKFSVGLPSAAALPDGGGLILYYAGPETDVTSIRWAVVRLLSSEITGQIE